MKTRLLYRELKFVDTMNQNTGFYHGVEIELMDGNEVHDCAILQGMFRDTNEFKN